MLEFFYWSRNKSENSEVYLRSFEVILDALNAFLILSGGPYVRLIKEINAAAMHIECTMGLVI